MILNSRVGYWLRLDPEERRRSRFQDIWEPRGADMLVTGMEMKQGDCWFPVSESVLARKR